MAAGISTVTGTKNGTDVIKTNASANSEPKATFRLSAIGTAQEKSESASSARARECGIWISMAMANWKRAALMPASARSVSQVTYRSWGNGKRKMVTLVSTSKKEVAETRNSYPHNCRSRCKKAG